MTTIFSTEPLSIHITNVDEITHKVNLRVYFNDKCIFNENLTVKPGNHITIENIAAKSGKYLVVITVDDRRSLKFSTEVAFGYAGVSVFIWNSTNIEIRQMLY